MMDFTKAALLINFNQVMRPIPAYLKKAQPGYLKIGSSGTIYSERIRQAEGFLRLLWGYAGYYKNHEADDTFQYLIQGIVAGTDPSKDSYWGDLDDVNQLMVEMAPLAVFILMNEDKCKAALTLQEQENLINWLEQINHHETARNNWLFFRILVDVCLDQCFGMDHRDQQTDDLAIIDSFYVGAGWYFDGLTQQRDYYISFAIHYYSLLYAFFCKEQDPKRAAIFRRRATEFAETFRYWFDKDGRGIPFGRSLTYRFAQSSFWSAFLLTVKEAPQELKDEARYLLFTNLQQWLKQDIFSPEGYLKIGYYYEDLVMAEEYNGPGSPYWALKAFVLLADENGEHHIDYLQQQPKQSLLKIPQAQMLITTNPEGDHVQAFPAGQYVETHSHGEAKYSKFVYSSRFGFSVAKGLRGWDKGGFDNVLAVSEQDEFYRVRTKPLAFAVHDKYIYHQWQPWSDVMIESFIIPLGAWHVRIHRVVSQRPLRLRDGGFAQPYDGITDLLKTDAWHQQLFSELGLSEVVSYDQKMGVGLSERWSNQNLYYPCVQTPYLTVDMSPGEEIFINLFCGAALQEITDPPLVVFTAGTAVISNEEHEYMIKFKEW